MTLKTFLPALSVVVGALVLYLVINRLVTIESRHILDSDCPELCWLQHEYNLTDDQYQKIEVLHLAHDEKCIGLCQQLASTQNALRQVVVDGATNSPEFKVLLAKWREHQKDSQDSILKHMFEVSAVMDDAQGKRYRDYVYQSLIMHGRAPHIDQNGEFHLEGDRHLRR